MRPQKRKKQLRIYRCSLLLSLLACLAGFSALLISGCASKPVVADLQPDGTQTVKVVVKHGYQPSHILAKAGQPLKIEFYRDEEGGSHSCDEVLEIPAENVKLPLPAHESQIVEIKPQPAGEMTFQCGMKMMKGSITFK